MPRVAGEYRRCAPPARSRVVSIGVLAWSMTPADVAAVVAQLDDHYRVVRGDQFSTSSAAPTTYRRSDP